MATEYRVKWKREGQFPKRRQLSGQRVERYDRCEHPSGPHPMHAPCGWFAAKTQGAMA